MLNLQVKQLAKEYYGLNVQVDPLVGYEDLNFKLTTIFKEKYVLKLSKKTGEFDHLNAQAKLLQYLNESYSDPLFPNILPASNGRKINKVAVADTSYYMRMLNYLEGEFFAEAKRSKDLYYHFGAFLGEMDTGMMEIELPEIHGRRDVWDLQYALDAERYITCIDDPENRKVVAHFMDLFKKRALPKLQHLRKSIIHSDANGLNVLVNGNRICGIIDFGDIAYSNTVNELAIGAAYAIMTEENPLEPAIEVVGGYHSELPLQEEELNVLYYLIATRMSVSVSMSSYDFSRNPENEYLKVSQKPAFAFLKKWIEIAPKEAEQAFKSEIV